jgi:hypothetical protein
MGFLGTRRWMSALGSSTDLASRAAKAKDAKASAISLLIDPFDKVWIDLPDRHDLAGPTMLVVSGGIPNITTSTIRLVRSGHAVTGYRAPG